MGASLIAQRSNALIIPVYAYKEDGKFCIEFFKAKDSQKCKLRRTDTLSSTKLRRND